MRKKLDSRIRTLVENCVHLRQRSIFVLVGDKGRDQVVNLHYLLSKTTVKARPNVLWCYKNDLYLSSHRQKRVRQIHKLMKRGLLDPETEDPFSLFVASTNIRYCYYHETHKILGNTFGMCVLQDFEALTPNLLARTMETVEGGGLIVLLLSTLSSLTQLYTLTMDVHSRFRTESHQDVTGRFNERLVLSLASKGCCLFMDDELNILPSSSHVRSIEPVPLGPDGAAALPGAAAAAGELRELVQSLSDTQPAGAIVAQCRTLDQARAVVTFLDAAMEKTLRATVALTAARGRGKSAAVGLAVAGSLALGYSNIFVTAPSPENLRTLFEFILKGLDCLDYKEHIDYDIVTSTNPAFNKAIVRINVFRQHRQTVQYIQPQHHAALAQAELLVIDEAAAIPLPLVKAMLGPYLVFLCSTVNGYEGTGRSLSLKLLEQLRAEGAKLAASSAQKGPDGSGDPSSSGRTFREVQLQEPIRYAAGDKVEAWLHELLCLDAAEKIPPVPARLPHPWECELYYVERDTLFSYHKASESLLQRMMALYVASHYRNTPNDLMLAADAPAHALYVLLGPVDETQNVMPDVLAVVQVALEGAISKKAAQNSLAHGNLPQGDLIPWTVGQQLQDPNFPSLSGVRIVRIATHPDLPRAGYGSRAVELLARFYQGDLATLVPLAGDAGVDAPVAQASTAAAPSEPNGNAGAEMLHSEQVALRKGLPPLLVNLAERKPEPVQWLGVSYGLTQGLLSFWHRSGFRPVYLRQTPSDVTGEHTIIMLRALDSPEVQERAGAWLAPFVTDFRGRLMALLPGPFRSFAPALALGMLEPQLSFSEAETAVGISSGFTPIRGDGSPLSPYDMKRLQAYANSLVDYHLIMDLVPTLACAFFAGKLPATLSAGQAAILLSLGLQQNDVSAVEKALNLPAQQLLALFNKAMRKLHGHLRAGRVAAIERTLPQPSSAPLLQPHEQSLDDDLDDAAKEVHRVMQEALKPDKLGHYAVTGDLDAAAQGRVPASGLVSVPRQDKVGDAGCQAPQLYKKDVKKGKRKGNFHTSLGQKQRGGRH